MSTARTPDGPPGLVLYHFTCADGYRKIGRFNCLLIPQRALWPVIWLTDQPEPDFQATGLRPHGRSMLHCDRTEHRYIVTDLRTCRPWLGSADRRAVPAEFVATLESYGDPEHWWITSEPVRAEWDRGWAKREQIPEPSPAARESL